MSKNKKLNADIVAIVSAAGTGTRMCSAQPKQYMTIGNRTILEHSIHALLQNPRIRHVVVVIHPTDETFSQLPIARDHRISSVVGSAERTDSVLAGLQHPESQQAEWVLVHDGVRPCLHHDDLQKLLQITTDTRVGGILAARVRDTIKRSKLDSSVIEQTVDRSCLWHALTPQLFNRALLMECFLSARSAGAIMTDEASVLEYCGYQPLLVAGRMDNIKVTYAEDLAMARFYLSQQQETEQL